MACYKILENCEGLVEIEQNIFDNSEIRSFDFKAVSFYREGTFELKLNYYYDNFFKRILYFLSYNFDLNDRNREPYKVSSLDLSFFEKIKSPKKKKRKSL